MGVVWLVLRDVANAETLERVFGAALTAPTAARWEIVVAHR